MDANNIGSVPINETDGYGNRVRGANYAFDSAGNIIGLVSASGSTLKIPRLIAEKTAVTDGAIQTADQVIGSLSIPAGSLNVGDVFRVMSTIGRNNNTDVGGTGTARMGTAGTTSDTAIGTVSLASILPGGSGALSIGIDKWYRVVSIGTNSVIESLGVASFSGSWISILGGSSNAVATQLTLTSYNLTTEAGYFTVTTTMGAATTTKPRTGYMRLEIAV